VSQVVSLASAGSCRGSTYAVIYSKGFARARKHLLLAEQHGLVIFLYSFGLDGRRAAWSLDQYGSMRLGTTANTTRGTRIHCTVSIRMPSREKYLVRVLEEQKRGAGVRVSQPTNPIPLLGQ
jgi:hypothetical protein